ncbi:hypothetical protein SCWH03_18090 [Streptomyces pacificus]|uniref:Uncharacterized protein n=1 Tax=Streptomyces pacificus TaxID=2705029 RepID=A0A6A0ASA7_9ACTN|nr:hypothetical protein SCWH03_18090 [Streptomyces pacificus]
MTAEHYRRVPNGRTVRIAVMHSRDPDSSQNGPIRDIRPRTAVPPRRTGAVHRVRYSAGGAQPRRPRRDFAGPRRTGGSSARVPTARSGAGRTEPGDHEGPVNRTARGQPHDPGATARSGAGRTESGDHEGPVNRTARGQPHDPGATARSGAGCTEPGDHEGPCQPDGMGGYP